MFARNATTATCLLALIHCGGDVTTLASHTLDVSGPPPSTSPTPGPAQVASVSARGKARGSVAPSFLWADRSVASAATRPGAAPTVEAAARSHLADRAGRYGILPQDAAALELRDIHDVGRGAIITRFGRRIDGVEVFGEQIAVATDRKLAPVALGGHITASRRALGKGPAKAGAPLDPASAVIAAIADLTKIVLSPGDLEIGAPSIGGYQSVRFGASARRGVGITSSDPSRVKPVLFPMAEGQLVPAHQIEARLGQDARRAPRSFSYVVGPGGQILWKKDLTARENPFSYRVYADDAGLFVPWDGPQGTASTPHPTGLRDQHQAAFVPAKLVTLSSLTSVGVNDPWLPPGATTTLGNNVDAYADLASPDGFTPGIDFRGAVTSPGAFDYVFAPELDAAASLDQRMAGITQLFYDINWFHDWFYAAGFTEASGNAQFSNYGRGGVEADAIRAEAQDSEGWNNAFMDTPADGARPSMVMFVWNYGPSRVVVDSPPALRGEYKAGPASFSPRQFELAGKLVRAEPAEACEPLLGGYQDALVLADDGGCDPLIKAENAQAAGARGLILGSVASSPDPESEWHPFGIPESPIQIGVLTLGFSRAEALRAALAGGETVEARLTRDSILRSGDVDNHVVAHEWGHYISNRLIGDTVGLDTNMASGLGEGWADFHALLMTARPEDTFTESNANWNGVYGIAAYARGSFTDDPYYFGIRRYPYSTDLSKNPLTFKHISDDGELPDDVPRSFDRPHTEVHALGEIWASMLWECYASLLRDTLGARPRLTFSEARERMRDYLVASYKLTPNSPTLLDARDALLAAALVGDPADHSLFIEAFAKRGAGVFAVAPDRFDPDNRGAIESYSFGAAVVATSATLLDDIDPVCAADGYLDDGETASLRLTFENVGNAATGGLKATLSTLTGGLGLPAGSSLEIPPLAIRGVAELTVPVLAREQSGIGKYLFAVQVGNAGAGAPPEKTFEFAGNQDTVAYQSFSDGAESPHVVWSRVSVPELPLAYQFERLALSPTEHIYRGLSAPSAATTDLVSPSLPMRAGESLSLSFRHRFRFESSDGFDYDGGVIEISRDGGTTWEDVGADAGYNGVLYPDSQNPLGGRAAFVAQSPEYPDFQTVSLNIDPAGASSLLLRFRIASDAYVSSPGWELDEITLGGVAFPPFDAVIAQPGSCYNPPLAVLGWPQFVGDIEGEPPAATRVTLDGSASFDADGDPLTYAWLQTGGPPVALTGEDTPLPSFIAPDVPPGPDPITLSFQLIVRDATVASPPAFTTVSVFDAEPAAPPPADAGAPDAD